MSGYVKLWRKMRNSRHWPKPGEEYHPTHAWIDMIFRANYTRKVWQGIVVERGEFITSENQLAHAWGWDRSRVRRFLDRCEAEQEITLNRTSKRTTIRINNFEQHQGFSSDGEQGSEQGSETKPNNKPNTTNKKELIINNNFSFLPGVFENETEEEYA